jgi:hypothetical protein
VKSIHFWTIVLLLTLSTTACYEDVADCLDPDATNFNVRADQACPDDCCEFPTLSLDITRVWGDTTLLSELDTLVDRDGNEFALTSFRFYFTDIELEAESGLLPIPENFVELDILEGADTVLTEINANLILVDNTAGTETVGRLRTGTEPLTQVQGRFGMSNEFPAVYPPSAPSSSPLMTQSGLLNFNDGQGYLLASVEYLTFPDSTEVRVDIRGNVPMQLPFGTSVAPLRGTDLTVEIDADFLALFNGIDVTASETTVAADLVSRLPFFLRATGVR